MRKRLVILFFVFIFPFSALSSDNPCEKKFRQIRANAMISGQLKDERDVNYYKITLKREGKLTASVRNLQSVTIQILDGLCFDIPQRGSDTSKAVSLSSGDWFLKVSSPKGVTGKYDLYVRFKPGEKAGNMEPVMGASALVKEPGDTDDHSDDCGNTTQIFMGSSIPGKFQGSKDIDVFHINLTQPTRLTVWSTGRADTRAVLKDSFCRPVFSDSNKGIGENFKITAGLKPGKYYISVSRESGKAQKYIIHASGAPLEPSDTGSSVRHRADINLTGKWNWSRTGVSNTLGLPMNTLKGSVVFKQQGNRVRIEWAKKYGYNGSVKGNVLVFHRTFKNGSAVIRERLEIKFATDTRGSGDGNWTIKNDQVTGSGVYRYYFVRAD